MGEPKTPHFYDFGRDFRTCPRLPKQIILIFGDTSTPQKIKNQQTCLNKYDFYKSRNFEIQGIDNVRKDGRRSNMKIRLITF